MAWFLAGGYALYKVNDWYEAANKSVDDYFRARDQEYMTSQAEQRHLVYCIRHKETIQKNNNILNNLGKSPKSVHKINNNTDDVCYLYYVSKERFKEDPDINCSLQTITIGANNKYEVIETEFDKFHMIAQIEEKTFNLTEFKDYNLKDFYKSDNKVFTSCFKLGY